MTIAIIVSAGCLVIGAIGGGLYVLATVRHAETLEDNQ
jgi:hypothetical protein